MAQELEARALGLREAAKAMKREDAREELLRFAADFEARAAALRADASS